VVLADWRCRLCRARDAVAVVVGGGNSAGQAAVFLAGHTRRACLLVRRADLAATMSRYLTDQLARHPAACTGPTSSRAKCSWGTCWLGYGGAAAVPDAAGAGRGQFPVRSVEAYFFHGRSINNG
jgi:hypothetical protein